MSWYNQIFTDTTPEKDSPIIMRPLPRVLEKPEETQEEKVAEISKLDFVFSNKFIFSQLPRENSERETFLNNAKSREDNPLGLKYEGFNALKNSISRSAANVNSAAKKTGTGVLNYFASFIPNIYTTATMVKGGKTQKRSTHNQKRTQRKHYSK